MNNIQNGKDKDKRDLILIRRMMKYANDGYDVELRKASGGGYKVLIYKKEIIALG